MKNACFYTGIAIVAILVLFVFPSGYCVDEVTITAYYPSPRGVYQTIMLTPSTEPAGPSREGDMYYDSNRHCLRVYTMINPTVPVALDWVDMCSPAGVIMMYSCTAALPSGWNWYNGRNGARISDHYIMGAGGAYAGGTNSSLPDIEHIMHNHDAGGAGSTYATQAHTHRVPVINVPAPNPLVSVRAADGGACDIWLPVAGDCSDRPAVQPGHTHATIAFDTGSAGAGAGSVVGSSTDENNEVPYYPTCFIIKQ